MNALPPTAERYLRRLGAALHGVPVAARTTILDDIRAHLSDAAADGRDIDDTLAALGSSADLARDAREQWGAAASDTSVDVRAGRALHWSALALGVVTAVFMTFLIPTGVEETVTSDGTVTSSTTTLFGQMGLGIGLLPLLPAALVLLPLLLPERARATAGWTVAGVVTVAMIPASASIGAFYLPLALLLWGAMLVPGWIRRGRNPVTGRIWRVVGALVLVSPAAFTIGGILSGSIGYDGTPFWITIAVVAIMAGLFAFRVPLIDPIVAVFGAGLMLLSMVTGGILTLAVWWAGGLWLVIGLCGFVARGGSRSLRRSAA